MRLILQRVSSASVRVEGETISSIGQGILALVGVEKGDGAEQVAKVADKLLHLRIFEDAEGRMNRDILEVGGSLLIVSQFTLAGSLAKGRRPSFGTAEAPEKAEPLIQQLVDDLRRQGVPVGSGRFRSKMEVELVNDGPVTFILNVESDCQPDP
jgi:D-tyrosyl-tRNA(Tyr) deacylase